MEEALTAVGLYARMILGRLHQPFGGSAGTLINRGARCYAAQLLVSMSRSDVSMPAPANILENATNSAKELHEAASRTFISHYRFDRLTTISPSRLWCYNGEVMEAGDVDAVIKNPQHPYTRLLGLT